METQEKIRVVIPYLKGFFEQLRRTRDMAYQHTSNQQTG